MVVVKICNDTAPEVPDGSVVKVLVDKAGNRTLELSPPKNPAPPVELPARLTRDDRKTALWALGAGGAIRVDGGDWEVTAAADLPQPPFRLAGTRVNARHTVAGAGIVALAGCTDLTSLDLNWASVDDVGLGCLKGLTDLTYLTLSDNLDVGDAGLAHLKGMGLTRLNLNGCGTTDAGVAHLARAPGRAQREREDGCDRCWSREAGESPPAVPGRLDRSDSARRRAHAGSAAEQVTSTGG